ncbi:MAG: hypothetical protein IJU39_05200 [Clostridia bacterium]|nr:hypothetical protein [Clostridia bacterium]
MKRIIMKSVAVMLALACFVSAAYTVTSSIPTSISASAAQSVTLKKIDGKWIAYSNGKVDKAYTGLAKNEYGWFYVKNGKLDTSYTGLAKNEYGWFYVKNGKLDKTYTGLAKNQYGWFYVKNGKLDKTYTGLAKNQYGWFYVKNGKLDKTYTGLAKNQYGWFYVKNGKLDTSYNGTAKNQYGTWNVKNGKVVSKVESTTKPTTTKPATTKPATTKPSTTKPATTKPSTTKPTTVDPANWSTEQIVDYYKKAAAATKGKSAQTMSIQELPAILSPLKGVIGNALAKSSTPFDGITGGYQNLTASDLTSASAKASGNYIIINMNAKEQIDGAYGKAKEGTTGHLVTVLDGVASVVDALGVSAEYPEGSVKLDYKNGYAKNVKINTKTGQIESGEWGYDLYANVNGAKLSFLTLRNVNAVIIYRVKYPA